MAKTMHALPTKVMPYQEVIEAAFALRAANSVAYEALVGALVARVHTIAYEAIDAVPQRLEHMQGRAAEARDLAAVLVNLSTAYQKIKEVKHAASS